MLIKKENKWAYIDGNDVFLQKMADDTFTDIIGSGKFNEERLGLGVDSKISYISKNSWWKICFYYNDEPWRKIQLSSTFLETQFALGN